MKLVFDISFFSDFNIGTGQNKGIIDSPIFRDKNNLPVILGTTLSGLLRNGIWELLQLELFDDLKKCKKSHNDQGPDYCKAQREERCPTCRILGSPGYSKPWTISQATLKDHKNSLGSILRWRNKVNTKKRTAEYRKLFNQEVVGKGTKFRFYIENEKNDETTLKEAIFITAAFKMIRHIGSNVRRGRGYCKIEMIEIDPNHFQVKEKLEDHILDLLNIWVEENSIALPPEYKNSQENSIDLVDSAEDKSFWTIFLAETPLLISDKHESGSVYNSISYIPGQTFLGALAWKMANRSDLNNDKIANKFIEFFRNGGIEVSPLFPAKRIGQNDLCQTIPIPSDLICCKLFPIHDRTIHDVKFASLNEGSLEKCQICAKKNIISPLKPIDGFFPFYIGDKPPFKIYKTERITKSRHAHIAIDLNKGIAEEGVLFHYFAINSEQYFIGEIKIKDWKDFKKIMCIKEEEGTNPIMDLSIGKATRRGYGAGKLLFYDPKKNNHDEDLFKITKFPERVKNLENPLILTTLSDAIIIDLWGRFFGKFDAEWLKNLIDLDSNTQYTIEIQDQYIKTKNVDGFNSHLGLPKWREGAISAGSTVRLLFTINGNQEEKEKVENLIIDKLKGIEEKGIGLRKNEGFGKICFNHPIRNINKLFFPIRLPEEMRIDRPTRPIIFRLKENWEEYLDGKISELKMNDDDWLAVARWLHSENLNIDNIEDKLSNFHGDLEVMFSNKKIITQEKFLENEKNISKIQTILKKLVKMSKDLSEENKKYWLKESLKIFEDKLAEHLKVKKK